LEQENPEDDGDEDEEDNEDDEDEEDANNEGFQEVQVEVEIELNSGYSGAVQDVRKLVKLFRKSPTKNDCLQKYVVEELGHEFALDIDVKSRWNSLLKNDKKLSKIKLSIRKALVDLSLNELFPEQQTIDLLEEISNSLEIVEAGARALCRRDVNLLSADRIFEYMLSELEKESGQISEKLYTSLSFRIGQRRLENYIALLRYLSNPKDAERERQVLSYPNKKELP
jgi:hypothetical protein